MDNYLVIEQYRIPYAKGKRLPLFILIDKEKFWVLLTPHLQKFLNCSKPNKRDLISGAEYCDVTYQSKKRMFSETALSPLVFADLVIKSFKKQYIKQFWEWYLSEITPKLYAIIETIKG